LGANHALDLVFVGIIVELWLERVVLRESRLFDVLFRDNLRLFKQALEALLHVLLHESLFVTLDLRAVFLRVLNLNDGIHHLAVQPLGVIVSDTYFLEFGLALLKAFLQVFPGYLVQLGMCRLDGLVKVLEFRS